MATYLELKEQAEKLLAEAERVREQEIEQAIADIKQKIREYGLNAQDLGLQQPRRVGRPSREASMRAPARANAAQRNGAQAAQQGVATYRGPNGEVWNSGRGRRKPEWLRQALGNGKKLEDFREHGSASEGLRLKPLGR